MFDLKILADNPELAKSLKLEITGADLLAFGEAIHKRAIAEIEKNAPKQEEEYLTTQQFADTLQVSLPTLWAWDKKGITKPLRIGNAKRYRRSDLEKLMEK